MLAVSYGVGHRMSDGRDTPGKPTPEELSELGRRLSAAKRVVSKVCPICQTPFTGPAQKKYDKHSCAVIASRQNRTRTGRPKREGAGRPPIRGEDST